MNSIFSKPIGEEISFATQALYKMSLPGLGKQEEAPLRMDFTNLQLVPGNRRSSHMEPLKVCRSNCIA